MAYRGLRKTHFFPHLKACERRNFDFGVFLRMCSVTVSPPENNPQVFRYTTHPLKHTKIKISLLTGLQMGKKMFFVIPEMPSKTFFLLYKKLPDHFKD